MNWIESEIVRSREAQRTTDVLACWVLSVADRALRSVYGSNYSTRCLQSSECIRVILEKLGIKATLWSGAVCVATIYPDGQIDDNTSRVLMTWSGFWDRDQHVWLYTEFGEIVDLTISQLELHPSSSRAGALSVPAIWWRTVGEWPQVIRYLPEGIGVIDLRNQDLEELESTLQHATKMLEAQQRRHAQPTKAFTPVLFDVGSLSQLYRRQHPWTVAAFEFQKRGIPFPPWILEREQELQRAFEQKCRT